MASNEQFPIRTAQRCRLKTTQHGPMVFDEPQYKGEGARPRGVALPGKAERMATNCPSAHPPAPPAQVPTKTPSREHKHSCSARLLHCSVDTSPKGETLGAFMTSRHSKA